jgi:hypothetical protein
MQIQYNGFTHLNNVREFIFHCVSPGQENKIILVTADLSLFSKYHVRLQEGPLLCLRKLTCESVALASVEQSLSHRELSEDDVCCFVADLEYQRKTKTHKRARSSGGQIQVH